MAGKYVKAGERSRYVRFRIDTAVADDLQTLRDKVKTMNVKLTIDEEVARLLKKIIKEANEELANHTDVTERETASESL